MIHTLILPLAAVLVAQNETIDVGTAAKRVVDTGKVNAAAAREGLSKAFDTAPNVTNVTIIICIGNAPQTPLDKIPPVVDELSKIAFAVRPKVKRNVVSRALDSSGCPTGVRMTLGNFDQRTSTLPEVRVIGVAGEVNAYTRDGRTVPLFKDSVVPEQSEIRTGKASRCLLLMPDGTQNIVREDARVSLQALRGGPGAPSTAGPSKLKLWAGKLWSAFKGQNHNLEIETQNAVAGVRGTEFQVNASKETTDSGLGVYDGKVAINSSGKQATVPQGYGVVAKEALSDVRPLPPAPDNLLPRDGRFKYAAHLRWDAVPNAVGYRFEMARDPAFYDVFFEQNFKGNKIEVNAAPGRYYWRVFTRDADELESVPSKLYAIEFQVPPKQIED